MSAALRTLFERVEKHWSPEEQDELAHIVHALEERRKGAYILSPEEREAIEEGIAQADRGEFVDDERRAAALKRYGL